MAKLFELCKTISPQIVRVQQAHIAAEQAVREDAACSRRVAKYEKRMGKVCANAFDMCKQARPARRRYHNTLFREQSGTIGTTIVTMHTPSGRAIVCRTKIY